MKLPPFPDLSDAILDEIVTRHSLGPVAWSPLPQVGIFNAIYALGHDYILRVPRDHPHFIATARKEAIVAPAARAAGVRTPAIVAFDDTRELLPVPYSIYERIHGATLGLLDHEPGETPGAWRALGHDLARLHAGVAEQGPIASFETEAMPDPRSWPAALAEQGFFTGMEARWLASWLDRLAPGALVPTARRFVHNDVQATNVMVSAESLEYLALLDWGSAGWGDPAWDFAAMPLRAVPFLLEGYREVAPLDQDDIAEARILWRQLQLALYLLQREPQPTCAWAERPLAMLLDIMRFAIEAPGGRWRDWMP